MILLKINEYFKEAKRNRPLFSIHKPNETGELTEELSEVKNLLL